jgi:hypothetical protein
MTNRPLFIVCDTNAAVRDAHLFRKKGGPQLVALLRAKNAKLVLPEVLRTEYITQFAKVSEEALRDAMKEVHKLQSLCGYRLDDVLPKAKFWEARALEVLEQLTDVIHSVPTTDELLLAAANRSIGGHRPTSKSDHGYKDCLIWESLLTLPTGSEVLFVSRDEVAFFDEEALTPSLLKEAEVRGLLLTAFNTKKAQSLFPVVTALTERFTDIGALTLGELELDAHPMMVTPRESEQTVVPVLPTAIQDAFLEVKEGAPASEELGAALSAARAPFETCEVKALGFVSFLRSSAKESVVELLRQAGVSAGVARNALERLVLAGLIRDTGHNYLAVESRLSTVAAALVEEEMIKLTGLGA